VKTKAPTSSTSSARLDHEAGFAVATELLSTSKNIFVSKTAWVQLLALAATFFPAIEAFISANPREAVAVLVVVNLIIRLATDGRVSILPSSPGGDAAGPDDTAAPDADHGRGGVDRVGILVGMLAVLFGLGLPACRTASDFPITGSFILRDPKTGAKGGLNFKPGAAPEWYAGVPLYNDKGELIGNTDLRGPLAGEVKAEK
jgi:hypothetical protein